VCKKHEEDVEYFPDNKLKLKIRKLTVKCLNRERGCQWKGRIGQLSGHLAECAGQWCAVEICNTVGRVRGRG
jgi:hypothetical protein